MFTKILLLISIALSAFVSACSISQASTEGRQEVVLEDSNAGQQKDEIVITDADLKPKLLKNSFDSNSVGQTVTAGDKSKITTTGDAYGNKTETRCFANHPRLDCVMVSTSADGKKQTLIYPVGSGAKNISEDAAEKALTASADELADLAGITQTRSDVAKKQISPYRNGNNTDNTGLRPMASSEFPVFPKQVSQPQPQQVEETSSEENDSAKEDQTKNKNPGNEKENLQ